MRLSDLLCPELVDPALAATRKDDVLRLLAVRVADRHSGIDADRLTSALCDRERTVSTALAEGVAIPHARVAGVDRIVAAFGRSLKGIDCDSHDGKHTHLFLVLVVPEHGPGSHLKLLAMASRLLHDPRCRARLMQAPDGASLVEAMRAEEDRALGLRAA